MSLQQVLDYCGFKTAFDFLYHHLSQDELLELLEAYVNIDDTGMPYEWIKEIAEEQYEYVDYEQLADDKDDAKYREWEDRRNG